MVRIVGFAGSLRAGSFNRALLNAAAASMPAGAELIVWPIDAVPLYDADVERASGIPAPVADLKRAIAAADGVVIATPEYNGGIPGIAKNVIDWLSRPPEDQAKVLHGKPVALMGATPGGFGTGFSQAAWLQVLRTLRMRVERGPFYVSSAAKSIDASGIIDLALEERLTRYMAGFVEFLAGRPPIE